MSATSPFLLAGFARMEITPPIGAAFTIAKRVERIIDPVYARALYLEQPGEAPVLLVAADHGGFDRLSDQVLRRRIAAATGVPFARVRLSATHNHTCPEHSRAVQLIFNEYGLEHVSLDWLDRVDAIITDAAVQAKHSCRPVTAHGGTGEVYGVAANRSVELEDGRVLVRLGYARDLDARRERFEAPAGVFDPLLGVLCLKGEDGKPLVTLVNFACHVTSLDTRGTAISPDFPGYALHEIERTSGRPAMFFQGCCGNIGTGKFADGSLERSKELGRRLAAVALRVMGNLHSCVSAPLKFTSWYERIRLRDTLPDVEALREKIALRANDAWKHVSMLNVVMDPDSSLLDLFILDGGDWQIVGFPAEFFIEGGLAARAASPKPFTFPAAYFDCTLWYIPTIPAVRRGHGYEANHDWDYTAPGAAEQIIRAFVERM